MNNYPLVISFHTPDQIYSDCAEVLRHSLDNFGMRYEIDCIEPLGNYQIICRHKAVFIKEKLNKYPHQSVVWMDADSKVVQYPYLLKGIKEDIASVLWAGKQLLISVLYCANNPRVHALIDKWIAFNEVNHYARNADQENLEDLLAQSSEISFFQLPESYAHVPGETPGNEVPVIMQYLASRTQNGFSLYQ